MTFFDVGQGDSCLIQTPFGQDILIDGGPDKSVIQKLSKAMPFYDRTIDMIIITHPHADHITGIIEVLQKYKVEKIYYSGVMYPSDFYVELLQKIEEHNVPKIVINKNQEINLEQDLNLKFLFPNEDLRGKEVLNLNNTSLVVRMDYKKDSFLFMADAEQEVEQILLKESLDLKADILKVGHQGAADSSSQEFLKVVSPEIAIVSVGEDNKYGHPSRRVLKRLEKLNAEIFRTDHNGDIKIISSGDNDYKVIVER